MCRLDEPLLFVKLTFASNHTDLESDLLTEVVPQSIHTNQPTTDFCMVSRRKSLVTRNKIDRGGVFD